MAETEKTKIKSSGSLLRKTLFSHLTIAAIFTVAVIFTGLDIWYVRNDFDTYIQNSLPVIRLSGNLETGFQRTLAALRGWTATGNEKFKTEREQTWDKIITPGLKQLDKLGEKHDTKILHPIIVQMQKHAEELQVWQWDVEDTANTPGNYPVTHFIETKLLPMQKLIESYTAGFLAEDKIEGLDTPTLHGDVKSVLANFTQQIKQSNIDLFRFINNGNESLLIQAQESLTRAHKNLLIIEQQKSNLAAGEVHYETELVYEMTNYENLFKLIHPLYKKTKNNVAKTWLATEVAPLDTQIGAEFHKLTVEVDREIKVERETLINSSNINLMIILAAIILAIAISIFIALRSSKRIINPITELTDATQQLAQGHLDHDLPIVTQDEIGTLTGSFNVMRQKRVHAEEEMEKAFNALQQSNDELRSLTYVASHDLKTPLHGISSLITFVLEDCSEKLDEKSLGYLNQVHERVEKMDALINSLLHFTNLGKAGDKIEEVYIKTLIEKVIKDVKVPKTFRVIIDEDMPTITTNTKLLTQVFTQLINNAVNHHDKGAGNIRISAKNEEHYCEFAVSDDGPGIAKDFHDKIFTMFQKLGTADKKSSGVGLPSVKKIVERSHGRVWIDSDVGQGTTVYFTWPKQFGQRVEGGTESGSEAKPAAAAPAPEPIPESKPEEKPDQNPEQS